MAVNISTTVLVVQAVLRHQHGYEWPCGHCPYTVVNCDGIGQLTLGTIMAVNISTTVLVVQAVLRHQHGYEWPCGHCPYTVVNCDGILVPGI